MPHLFKKVFFLLFLTTLLVQCKKIDLDTPDTQQVHHTFDITDIHFVTTDTGFAVGGGVGEGGIILKTTNGGDTWETYPEDFRTGLLACDFYTPNYGIAVGFSGIVLKTMNGGSTWQQFPTSIWYQFEEWPYLRDIDLYSADEAIIVSSDGILIYTFDQGSSWQIDTLFPILRGIHFSDEKTGYLSGLGFVLKTVDGGASWDTTDIKGDNFQAITTTLDGSVFTVGYQGAIRASFNQGKSWEKQRARNLPVEKRERFTCIHFITNDVGYAGGYDGLLLKTTNQGKAWKKVTPFTEEDIFTIEHTEQALFIGASKGHIFRFPIE